MNESNLFVERTIELKGNSQNVFKTDDSIIVVTEQDGTYYAIVFNKNELGL